MGTAPRNPTHDVKNLALMVIPLNGAKDNNTARGLDTTIINIPTKIPTPAMGNSSEGFTNKPSVRNMIIWNSHDNPSKNFIELRLCTKRWFPINSPPAYTAR